MKTAVYALLAIAILVVGILAGAITPNHYDAMTVRLLAIAGAVMAFTLAIYNYE